MRKKSHISLAKYLVESMNAGELSRHKKAFYLGSILPDCKPSFLTTKHEINGTFDMVKESINQLTIDFDETKRKGNGRVYCRNLGQVIHYLADYFTFPHNETYDGNLKEHCVYEKQLKFGLKDYIKSGEAERSRDTYHRCESPEALFRFIQKSHDEYLKFKKTVEEDCWYIVSLCHQVVENILYLFDKQRCAGLSFAA